MKKEEYTEIKNLMEVEEYEKAKDKLERRMGEETKRPEDYLLLARCYLKLEETENAARLLKEGKNVWPNHRTITVALARMNMLQKNYPEALKLIGTVDEYEQYRECLLIVIRALLETNETEKAFGKLKKLEGTLPVDLAVRFALEEVKKNHDVNRIDRSVRTYLSRVDPNHRKRYLKILETRLWKTVYDEFLTRRTMTRLPNYLYTLKHPELFELVLMHLFLICEFFLRLKQYDRLIEILAPIELKGGIEEKRKEWYLTYASILRGDAPPDLPLAPDHLFYDGSVFHYRFGTEKCFIWFAGNNIGNTAWIFHDVVPILEKNGISLLIVFDSKKLFSILGFGKYHPERTAAEHALKLLLDSLSYTHRSCGANSAAGLSAILYGTAIDAEGILGINALTKMNEDFLDSFLFTKTIVTKKFRDIPIPDLDVYDLISRHRETLFVLYYSRDFGFDRNNAEYVSGLENTVTIPIDYNKHDLMKFYEDKNRIGELFFNFLTMIGWLKDHPETEDRNVSRSVRSER